jgi:hypothetical protein
MMQCKCCKEGVIVVVHIYYGKTTCNPEKQVIHMASLTRRQTLGVISHLSPEEGCSLSAAGCTSSHHSHVWAGSCGAVHGYFHALSSSFPAEALPLALAFCFIIKALC